MIKKITYIVSILLIFINCNNNSNFSDISENKVRSDSITKHGYIEAFNRLKIGNAFGGFFVETYNPTREKLTIIIQYKDSVDNWSNLYTECTSKDSIFFTLKGFASPIEIALFICDQKGNQSDTFQKTVIPYIEEQIPLSGFKPVFLPGDVSVSEWGFQMSDLWSGKINPKDWNMIHSLENPDKWPQWFSFDMGVVAKLSRIRYWQRPGEVYLYQHGNPKVFELWGSETFPDSSGSFIGWTLLMTCQSIKPSGSFIGTLTNKDILFAVQGENFDFPADIPPVRYLRMKVLETWSDKPLINFQQMWFWGQIE